MAIRPLSHILLVTVFIHLIIGSIVLAGIDPVKMELLGKNKVPLTWHNIVGPPELISDLQTHLDNEQKYHFVTLVPGQDILFRLPPQSIIRIFNPSGELVKTALTISVSDGNGLFINQPSSPSRDLTSLFILPGLNRPALARIKLADTAVSPVSAALFTSSYETVAPSVSYRNVMNFTAPKVKLSKRMIDAGKTFYRLDADRPTQVRLVGPAHYSLEQRMLYSGLEGDSSVDYTLLALLNAKEFLDFNITTEPENHDLIRVGDHFPLLGRTERCYFSIPEGEHVLTLVPTETLYARLTQKEESNFLFPQYNDPYFDHDKQESEEVDSFSYIFPLRHRSAASPDLTPSRIDDYTGLLWRENRYPEGGLSSTMAMARLAELYPGFTEAHQYGSRIAGAQSFFRDLHPESAPQPVRQHYLKYFAPALKEKAFENHVIPPETAQFLLKDGFRAGVFSELPGKGHIDNRAQQLHFTLPTRQTASELRLLVPAGPEPQSIGITIGNSSPIVCEILPETIRPLNEFRLKQGEAAMGLHLMRDPSSTAEQYPDQYSRIVRVASFSLPLKHPADSVIIKRLDDNQSPTLVALQYRDSRPFSLTEHQYQKAEGTSGDASGSFKLIQQMLEEDNHVNEPVVYKNRATSERAAFYRPLVRIIKTLRVEFTSAVSPPQKESNNSYTPQREDIDYINMLIGKAVQQQQWVVVVEHSSYLYRSTEGQAKREAADNLITALQNSGEHYLAELYLKGMFLFPEKKEDHLSNWALNRLEELYQGRKDLSRLATLYSVCLVKNPTAEGYNKLSQVLFEQGKQNLALLAALVPQPSQRSSEQVLQTSLAAGWLTLFDSALEAIEDKGRKFYWLGLKMLERGDLAGARDLFAQEEINDDGYRQAIESAQVIRTDAASPAMEKRVLAIHTWEEYQDKMPGPWRWKNEPQHIYEHAGGALLYSEAQNLNMLMFRSENNSPVRLRFWGPLTLATTIRPLHRKGPASVVNGWVRIHRGGALDLVPITNNIPNQQWHLPGRSPFIAGMGIEYQRHFGPGFHDISISSDTLSLLISLRVMRPVYANLALPFLSPQTVQTVLANRDEVQIVQPVPRLSCLTSDCLSLLPEEAAKNPQFFPADYFYLGLHEQKSTEILDQSSNRPSKPFQSSGNHDSTRGVAQLMAEKRWQEALEAASVSTPEERDQMLVLLTYLAEINTEKVVVYEARAQRLLADYPDITNGPSLLRRIGAHSRWEQVPFIQGSAGLRMLPYQTWRPEDPSLRIRKALLGQQPDGQTVLAGPDSIVLTMENSGQTELEVTFSFAELPYLKPESMTVACRLNNEPAKQFTLHAEDSQQTLHLYIPVGSHRLTISVQEQFTNQYLWVNFKETLPLIDHDDHPGSIWLSQIRERAFHVVSHDDPLVAMVSGPAWIRIDELLDGDIRSVYRYIASGHHPVELQCDKREEERLVRIFRRVADTEIAQVRPLRNSAREYQKMLPPLIEATTKSVNPQLASLINLPPPPPEQKGSWSSTLSYHRRRDLQEDTINDEPEIFSQINGTYQSFIESLSTYLQSSVFMRQRATGGPTFGVTGNYTWKNNELPLILNVHGETFAQNPDGSSFSFYNADSFEWSARVRVSAYQYRLLNPKLTHRPMISLFGRVISTDSAEGYEEGALDQDIFTPYKADHRFGLQLSEYLSYRPWLDSQFNARAVYALNEDLNPLEPDHLRVRLGWRQLFGRYQFSSAYQFTRFFDDEDRSDIVDRNDLSLGFLWDLLFNADDWLRLNFNYRFQIDTGEHTGMIGLTWYFGGNRALFHQRPEDDPFYAIRKLRAITPNNN